MARFTPKQTAFLAAIRKADKPLHDIVAQLAITPNQFARWNRKQAFLERLESVRDALALQRTLDVEIAATMRARKLSQPSEEKIPAAAERLSFEMANLHHKPRAPQEKQLTGLDLIHPNARPHAAELLAILNPKNGS